MSTDKPVPAEQALLSRAMDMQDVAGAYVSTARSTASRLAKARAQYDSGELVLEEYQAVLRMIESEDKLLTNCAKNFERGTTISNAPASIQTVTDYDAKLRAIR